MPYPTLTVQQRNELVALGVTPHQFFPDDDEQQARIVTCHGLAFVSPVYVRENDTNKCPRCGVTLAYQVTRELVTR